MNAGKIDGSNELGLSLACFLKSIKLPFLMIFLLLSLSKNYKALI